MKIIYHYDPTVLLLDIYTRVIKTYVHKTYLNVHNNIVIPNSQKSDTTQMSINWGMDE